MADKPREPGTWREWVRADYEYPDEDWDDLSRNQRRQARRRWRREDHQQRMSWLRDQRQSEPAGPAGVLVAVVLLAVVVLGVGGLLPRLLNGNSSDKPSIGLLTPKNSLPAVLPTQFDSGTPGQTPSPTETQSQPTRSPSAPVATARLSTTERARANAVAVAWAKVFYSRHPATETYEQLVGRAGQYMTDEVADSFLSAGDSTYGALKASNGTSKVVTATGGAPRPQTAPVDTPTRVTRLLSVTIQVTGDDPAQLSLPLLVTLVPGGGRWLVSDVNGGSGS